MQIGEIQQRILSIQSRMAAIEESRSATEAAKTGKTTASGAEFATALDAAVAEHDHDHGATTVKPTDGRVTSEFGPRWGTQHKGLDLAAAEGTDVKAAAGGTVRRADWYGGYGNAVVIDHGDGTSTLYGHNSELEVKAGQRVEAGQVIAKVGSTGDSTGPHVHFEVRENDKQINPRPWLESRGVKL